MRRWLAVLAGVALGVAVPRARAANPTLQRVVIDRVDLEPSPLIGFARLRVFVSAINLGEGGKVMPIYGDHAWKLELGGEQVDIPYIAGLYDGTDSDTAIVLIVEKAAEYEQDLPAIKTSLDDDLLSKLDDKHTRVAVIGYGDEATVGKLGTVKQAQAKLAALSAESEAGSPNLLFALQKALSILKNAKTDPEGLPLRKLIVVVSDGQIREDDPTKITSFAAKAAAAGVRIDPIAYTTGFKGPLLNLGELAKRSFGMLRWAQTPDAIPGRIQATESEIDHQYVLTWLLPAEDAAAKKISIIAKISASQSVEASNPVSAPTTAMCGGQECAADGYCVASKCVTRAKAKGRGIFGWILLLGGIAVGGVIALALLGAVLNRAKRKPRPIPVPMPGVVPGAVPGAPGPGAAAPAPAPAPPAPVVGPQIYMMTGPRTGERIALRHGFLIGKQPGCDLLLDQDGFASSQHAQILMDQAGNCTLIDKGSTNGTFVNGVRVTQYALTHGVAVRVGSTDFRFLAQ